MLIMSAALLASAFVSRKTLISATDAMWVSNATTIFIRRLMLAIVSVIIRALPSSLASRLAYSGIRVRRFALSARAVT